MALPDLDAPPPRVLIVDDSRIVRATLVKRIRSRYDFREEADGEAGWQALVLDHSIHLVITDLSMPVLDGYGLLKRIRASKLARIREIPVIMLSGDEDEESLERAKSLGASDFIAKGVGAAELLARIDSLVRLTQTQNQLKENRALQVQEPESGLFTRKYIELQAAQALSLALRQDGWVSVMLIAFDPLASLQGEQGGEMVRQLEQRFLQMLAGKTRKEDSLGRFGSGQFAIVSPGTPPLAGETFANRLRQAIAVANISAHGQKLNLSISVGVANSPADTVSSAGALLELAAGRLRAAQKAGGNRVIACLSGTAADLVAPRLAHAIELIKSGNEKAVIPHLAALGEQIKPLLALLERERNFRWPPVAGNKS
jgi:diguanylate cyclase (GGDEF)-like protein